YGLGLEVNTVRTGTGPSDHYPFWQNGYDAVLIIEKMNQEYPYYHTTEDTVDKLNFTFTSKIVKILLGAVASFAEINSHDERGPSHSYEVPPPWGYSVDSHVNISVSVKDPSGVNHSSIELHLDGNPVPFYTYPVTFGYRVYTDYLSLVVDSTYTARIMATDVHGNSLNYSWNFTVDDSPPYPVTGQKMSIVGNDILINWDVSPSPDFSHFAIFRADTPDSFTFHTPLTTTTNTQYINANVASQLSSAFYAIRAVDAAGNMDEEYTVLGKHTITIYDGWNLVGYPFQPTDRNTEQVFSYLGNNWKRVWSYDANKSPNRWAMYDRDAPEWLRDYKMITSGQGIWVETTGSNLKLCMTGKVLQNVTFELKKGWNLIAYPGFNSETLGEAFAGVPYDLAYAFHPGMEPYRLMAYEDNWGVMKGGAYWLHLYTDFTWTYQTY
ncbi:MAG TPA: M28 family peptidase, partial [Euryarchaeota archaeon]|nr:M28 family peptidase [Euryarchaeota archaeon]